MTIPRRTLSPSPDHRGRSASIDVPDFTRGLPVNPAISFKQLDAPHTAMGLLD